MKLEGFCPVRLIRERQWISGQEEFAEDHRGITYYFSSENARNEFRKDYRKFTPQNLGCDPVVLHSDQKAIIGQIKFFVERIYFTEHINLPYPSGYQLCILRTEV